MGLLSGDNKSGSWLSRKENIGLIVGPLLFVATILIPVPTSMANAAIDNSLPTFAPQLALGTMLWMVVWWVMGILIAVGGRNLQLRRSWLFGLIIALVGLVPTRGAYRY